MDFETPAGDSALIVTAERAQLGAMRALLQHNANPDLEATVPRNSLERPRFNRCRPPLADAARQDGALMGGRLRPAGVHHHTLAVPGIGVNPPT